MPTGQRIVGGWQDPFPVIDFDQWEMDELRKVAEARNLVQREAGQTDGLVDKKRGSIAVDVDGAIAEAAVAWAVGLKWDGVIFNHVMWQDWRRRGCDVGPLEVRATRHFTGRLIVHPDDRDDAPFVLALIGQRAQRATFVVLAGWLFGREAKQPDYWQAAWPRPAYGAPQSDLRSMLELAQVLQFTPP